MSLRVVGAALALGLGLAGAAIAPASAVDSSSTVRLSIAVPIVVPADANEFLGAAELAQYTSEFGLLTRQLDAVIDRPVAVGVDPRIIASIRLLGTTAPPTALAWLDRLESATNPTFSLGWADADVTLQTQSGAGAVLHPESFDFAIDSALFAPIPTATPTSSPSPVAEDLPPLPTSKEILDWQFSLTGLAWPRDDTAIGSDLPKIVASGYTTTILSSNNVARDASAGPAADVEGAAVLVSDSPVSEALRAATAALATDWDATMARLSAAISAAARVQSGTATVFATLDRTVLTGGHRLSETLDALATDPAVDLVPMTEALDSSPVTAAVIDEPQPADRLSRAGQMIEGANAERQFASVASDPARITSDRRLQLLTLLSSQWESDLEGWAVAADAFTTESIALRTAVHLVESSNFLLIADNGQYLPITVSNGLDQDVTVYVTVRSRSALLSVDDGFVKLEIKPGTQSKVDVPVHSLSNGVVEVDVSLSSSTGVPIGAPISSEVNVQAGWETPIVIVIAALVVVVFGVGVVRTVIRRRRANLLEADDD
jgi:hypothetical protein